MTDQTHALTSGPSLSVLHVPAFSALSIRIVSPYKGDNDVKLRLAMGMAVMIKLTRLWKTNQLVPLPSYD